jgi:glucose/arabinose dehydrogenase
MLRLRCWALAVALAATACGSQNPSTPPTPPIPGSSPDSPVTITGTERIGWNQSGSTGQIADYQSTAYVDDQPFALDTVCQSTGTVFLCLAPLPPMLSGPHRIEITQSNAGLESARSAPLYVVLALVKGSAPAGAGRASSVITAADGTRISVETLATGLDAPSALSATPDGRLFIAQASGEVSVWQAGRILPVPGVELRDVQRVSGVGLIGMTLHPDFSTNGLVFVAYVGRDRNGRPVNRISRFREFNNTFGESIVILEDRAEVAPLTAPRIRFGPDKKLYVAFPASDWPTADNLGSYGGKILRLNEDGTTPRDNRRASPILSAGHIAIGGIDWQPGSGRLSLAGRNREGRDVLSFLSPESEVAVVLPLASALDSSGGAFYTENALAPFKNDLFISGLASRQLRRVHFNARDLTRIDSIESLLDGQYGRLGDVITGPGGVLYVSTSNRGAGLSAVDDDRVLRLGPAKP